MIKQIYSLMNYNESIQVMDAGADHIGFLPMQSGGIPSHRVPLDVADRIIAEARRRGVKSSAIMLQKNPDEMLFLAQRLKPDILHIAGMDFSANMDFAGELKRLVPGIRLMQSVLVDGPGAISMAKYYAQFCDYILTDSGLAEDTGIGSSGKTHNWDIDAQIVRLLKIPVIVAGGLGPDNVEECIRRVQPYGVDSLTRTSWQYMDGVMEKDIPKVREFCRRADSASVELKERACIKKAKQSVITGFSAGTSKVSMQNVSTEPQET